MAKSALLVEDDAAIATVITAALAALVRERPAPPEQTPTALPDRSKVRPLS